MKICPLMRTLVLQIGRDRLGLLLTLFTAPLFVLLFWPRPLRLFPDVKSFQRITSGILPLTPCRLQQVRVNLL